MTRPGAFPDHSTTGNDRKTTKNKEDDADVWDPA